MNIIVAKTKLYENRQTAIPSEIRKKFGVDENTIIEWGIDENDQPTIRFRKKINLKDLEGAFDLGYETNAVELEKGLYND